MNRPTPLALAAGALLLLSGCLKPLLDLVKISAVQGLLTSGGEAPDAGAGPARDFPLLEYALVAPLVARPYRAPAEVGRCWQRWAAAEGATGTLLEIGARRDAIPVDLTTPDGGTALKAGMDRAVACGPGPASASQGQPYFRCGPDGGAGLVAALDCPVAGGDRVLLAYSVLQVADAVYGQRSALWPGPLPARPGPAYPAYLAGLRQALGDAAALLLQPAPGPQLDPRGTLPALALSGGAANGAFTAGYAYRLLAVREQALAAAGPTAARELLARERFGAAVSTSVGSLIGPVLDLYFDDARGPGAPPLPAGTLEACLGAELLPAEAARVPAGRAAQACALRLLRRYFTRTHDWHLLCVEDGSLTELLGVERPAHPLASVLAFDPMRDRVLTPFYRAFGDRLVTNDLLVQQMAVDVEQRVTLGLDERVCAALPAGPERTRCLVANTMASLVEPVLSRSLDEVYVRVGQPPVRGQWVDGGLRSGSPTLRALRQTGWPLELASSTAVLSLSTHRAEGTPTSRRATLPALTFDTVGTFADQIRAWEIAYTGALAEVERTEVEVWTRPGPLRQGAAAAVPTFQLARPRARRSARPPSTPPAGALVDSVVMPESVAFGEPIATATLSEYSFDPVVMTQLFVEGELTAVLGLERRLGELGWTEALRWYARPANRQAVEDEVRARWEAVRRGPKDPAGYQAAAAARRQDCLQVCDRNGGPAPAASARCLEVVPDLLLEAGRPALPW